MENHPIPQDVTGFQFKLVGSMTLKQFGYVGVGVILAVVFFYVPSVPWFLKLVLVPFFAVTGLSLAFLPIGGRPMDLMAAYFAKAILKPNQYVYQKVGGTLNFMELTLKAVPAQNATQVVAQKTAPEVNKKEEQLMSYLYDTQGETGNPLDARENQFLTGLFTQPTQASTQQNTVILQKGPQATPAPSQPIVNPPNPAAPAEPPAIPQATTQVNNMPPIHDTPDVKPTENIPAEAEKLTESVQPQQPEAPGFTMQPVPPPTVVQVVPESNTPAVQNPIASTGMEFPNLVTGIIKDSRGNVLAGILVEVLNKDGESVRAFKTNALGQFASATQLTNGSYTIVFEDPKGQHKFNNVQIETNGSILPPLNVTSVDAREELRRSLFG